MKEWKNCFVLFFLIYNYSIHADFLPVSALFWKEYLDVSDEHNVCPVQDNPQTYGHAGVKV
jgi:hypothetical protein